jgi:hypothetical protein
MKLYLLTQDESRNYDAYDSCVVVAPTAGKARKIRPSPYGEWGDDSTWAKSPANVTVKFIGTAAKGLKEGLVVCSSFNAG